MNSLIIETDKLKRAFEIALAQIESRVDGDIVIPQDYYLTFPMDEAYNLVDNVKPAVGSLFDDWENISRVVNKEQPATLVDLDRLAAVIKAIGQELNPPLNG